MADQSILDFVKSSSAGSRTPMTKSVDTPAATAVATEKAAPIFKATRVVVDKADPTIIIGIGAVAGNTDLDNETLSQKAMTEMAHQFCSAKGGRTFKMNHETEIKADLCESWIGCPIYELADGSLKVIKALDQTPDGAKFAGISNQELSHWFIAVRPADQGLVAKAAAGECQGFSWGAWVDKETSE
jgi:hypothetical protein